MSDFWSDPEFKKEWALVWRRLQDRRRRFWRKVDQQKQELNDLFDKEKDELIQKWKNKENDEGKWDTKKVSSRTRVTFFVKKTGKPRKKISYLAELGQENEKR